MAQDPQTPRPGLARRTFLQYSAGAGLLLGTGSLLQACAGGSEEGGPGEGGPGEGGPPSGPLGGPLRTEARTYVFNFAHMDTSTHDLILVAGKQRVPLQRTTPAVLQQVRQQHPILTYVPDHHLTHHVQDLAMPAAAVQLCYVQRAARGRQDGRWDMALLFYHHPTSALLEARQRGLARQAHLRLLGRTLPEVPVKWLPYGLTPALRAALNDPVGEAVFLDPTSLAVTLVASHPELLSGEPNSAADIHTNIIGTQSTTQQLGQVLTRLGPATPQETPGQPNPTGWATLEPVINPDTGQQATNSQGQLQYLPVWSQTTGQFTGQAISPALDTVKDDPTLGVNITTIDPTALTSNDLTAPTTGRIWTLHDGRPTVDQSGTSGLQATALPYQFTNQSPGHGYAVEINAVGTNDAGLRTITFTAQNWFVRYLSLYVRYLDANNQPIPLATIGPEIKSAFPFWDEADFLNINRTYDAFLDLVFPEFEIMGIPIQTTATTKTIPVPREAASVLILASGLGFGGRVQIDQYDDVIEALGGLMTLFDNFGLPSLFLALNAATGYITFEQTLQRQAKFTVMKAVWSLLKVALKAILSHDPAALVQLIPEFCKLVISTAGADVVALIAASIAEGEEVSAVEDAIPLFGQAVAAVQSLALVAQLAQTSVEVLISPPTYVDTIVFTHDIAVTIAHDPKDPAGFPATATGYTVTALFDGGTPHTITQTLSGTRTAPITVTFQAVPAGGKVKVDVGFYTDTGSLVGQGSTGAVDNTATVSTLPLTITITELLVPLTATTQYRHKEIITLDSAGRHVWQASATPPAVVTPQGLCDDVNGHICSWNDITVSTTHAAVGYAWKAYNSAVRDCVSGGLGQLHQFANLSITQDPQSGYLFSGCGFSGEVRIVYDLLGTQERNFYLDPSNGGNYLRQIRLSAGGPSSFDGPTSNRAFGQLRFPSDALLLHPLGKIISLNTALNKLEVLDLPPAAVADANAPQSQVYSGVGTREGLLQSPIHAAVTAQGTILVLEQDNNRIQAFDIGGNPVPYFAQGAYFVPLKDPPSTAIYLDLAVEYSGYLYVLSSTGQGSSLLYRLDLYRPDGAWLARTTGVNADKLAVNYWRDLFTLNYQVLTLPGGALPGRTEPSVSHWIPSTP